jgi:hypothetical protein
MERIALGGEQGLLGHRGSLAERDVIGLAHPERGEGHDPHNGEPSVSPPYVDGVADLLSELAQGDQAETAGSARKSQIEQVTGVEVPVAIVGLEQDVPSSSPTGRGG